MEVGWGGEGRMVGNIGLLASHLSHLTKSHRPRKDILPPPPFGQCPKERRFFWMASLNYLINDKDVCRTAPATQGLLNIRHKNIFK